MSTVGERTRAQVSQKTAQEIVGVPKRQGIGARYHAAVKDLIDSGSTVGEAIKIVAEREGASIANVSNAHYRAARRERKAGDRPMTGIYVEPGTESRGRAPVVTVPKDVADVIDAIKKDRQSLANNIDRLLAWHEAQVATIKDEKLKAFRQTVDAMREAAGL